MALVNAREEITREAMRMELQFVNLADNRLIYHMVNSNNGFKIQFNAPVLVVLKVQSKSHGGSIFLKTNGVNPDDDSGVLRNILEGIKGTETIGPDITVYSNNSSFRDGRWNNITHFGVEQCLVGLIFQEILLGTDNTAFYPRIYPSNILYHPCF
jgi:hypothetical protein